MATKSFEVKKYYVFIRAKMGGGRCATIECIGSHAFESMYINFYPHNSPPQNVSIIETKKTIGHIQEPTEQYAWYLDLLRNEGPIYARVDDSNPHFNSLSTSSEPVGEGE